MNKEELIKEANGFYTKGFNNRDSIVKIMVDFAESHAKEQVNEALNKLPLNDIVELLDSQIIEHKERSHLQGFDFTQKLRDLESLRNKIKELIE